MDDRQRPEAVKVEFADREGQGSAPIPKWPFAVALVVLSVLGGWAVAGDLHAMVPATYLALSVIAYLIYGYDKYQAESNGWRIPESSLHLLALMGGWPGALCAQRVMRHKLKKQSFMYAYWLTVLLNSVALATFSLR